MPEDPVQEQSNVRDFHKSKWFWGLIVLEFVMLVECGTFVLFLGNTPFRVGIDGIALMVKQHEFKVFLLGWPFYACFAITVYATSSLLLEDFHDEIISLVDGVTSKEILRKCCRFLPFLVFSVVLAGNTGLMGLYIAAFQLINSV
jgi:hypothetical protein